MTIKFSDASKWDKGLKHQIDAWEYLQANTPPNVLQEFAKKYRNEKPPIPKSGVYLIKEFEDCDLVVYPDPKTKGKPYTVGWGSTRKKDGSPFKLGEKITQKEADELFDYQIENEFLPQLRKIPYWNEMNENQQGALLSFAYNLGADFYGSKGFDTISRNLREKNWNAIPKTLELYCDPGSDVEAGLLRRRKVEGTLWSRK